KYVRGYYGRLAAKPSDEFLERANIRDSEYVTEAPAAHLEPWVPRLRAELGSAAGDEDLLLAAFYDRKLIEPLRNPAPECRFRTTPLTELVGYLATRTDIGYARIRFAGTDMMVPRGVAILLATEPQIIRRAMAVTVIVFGFVMLRGWRYSGRQRVVTSVGLGALSGGMVGATSIGAPPVILYLLAGPDPIETT